MMYLYPFVHCEVCHWSGQFEEWWLILYVLGAGCLGSKSSGWHDVLVVGCVTVASGGVDLASPAYPKACLIAASLSMSSLVAHACLSIGFVDIHW